MIQMIRNRISAQNSRDKKKEYIKNLENENQLLKDQNELMKEKLIQLEKDLNSISYPKMEFQCNYCGSVNSPYNEDETTNRDSSNISSPNILMENEGMPNTKKDFFKFGLFMLSIISFVLFIGVNNNEANSVSKFNIFENKSTNTFNYKNFLLQIKNNTIDKNKDKPIQNDFPFLKNIDKLRKNYPVDKPKPNFKDSSIFYSLAKKKEIEEKSKIENQLAPLNFFENPNISTVFCPTPYIYRSKQEKQNDDPNKSALKLLDTDWLHLVLPSNSFSEFVWKENNFENSQIETIEKIKKSNFLNSQKDPNSTKVVELWCKVYKTKEI